MAVLPILTAPHPTLARKARDVRPDEIGADLERLVSDMAETMYAAPGVGLAAPQVDDSRRVVVIDSGSEGKKGTGLLRMVNPLIVARSAETIVWGETCLSVPDLEVDVVRNKHIRVTWLDPATGAPHDAEFHEFEAVIVQHELDHLLGTVLLDRVSHFRRSRYLRRARGQPAA
ncbi:MAG TPA: peptide deformylase [Myxococcota bacterium]|nr:peptide deformylase [Myxococcota bacterium]